jgi:hypothetical protein
MGDNPVKKQTNKEKPWAKTINGRQPDKKINRQGENLGQKQEITPKTNGEQKLVC